MVGAAPPVVDAGPPWGDTGAPTSATGALPGACGTPRVTLKHWRSAQPRRHWPPGTSTGTPASCACTLTPRHPDLSATAASTCTPAGGMHPPTAPSPSPAPGTCPGTTEGGVVVRRCGPDGRWVTDEMGRPWQDHSQCEDLAQEQPLQRQAWLLEQFRLLYTVGYSLSLIALLLALLLLLIFRRLRCTRNFIHANLFLSFVLRAGAILTRDALLQRRLRPGPGHPLQLLGQQAVAGCRLAQALTQYCVGANYGWLLAEGLFLHKLLVLAAFSGERCLPAFLLLGWGAPVLFVVPWVVVRYLYENEGCWERNEKAAVWWIIRCPILMAVAVGDMAQGMAIPGQCPHCRGCHHWCSHPQAGQVNPDADPAFGGARGGLCPAGGGAKGGHPALGAALPAAVALLLPGPRCQHPLLLHQQGGAGGGAAWVAAVPPGCPLPPWPPPGPSPGHPPLRSCWGAAPGTS
ncbi:gastric inhibitory polypeptide receptor isoform X2 [Phalacrocorax carbo]|uniref:gastric inhibitory polypeptide receptor isoform X2 n=1 Tax=Phalacrocorax carbo TaxID=9209 RepID=UPI00311996C7